jgi:mannose-6-phosphate isomerase-like protein (cupin superfamily)/hypoxanthine phosphoribosyltransferase
LTDKQLWTITGDDGNFDRFFTDLDIEVQNCHRVKLPKTQEKLDEIEGIIIKKEQTVSGHIKPYEWTKAVTDFIDKIHGIKPDCLVFIDDPCAPGGMMLKQKLQKDFEDKVKICTIEIAGITNRSRCHERAVRSSEENLQKLKDTINEARNILVLDAIAFSGNTLCLALEKLKELSLDKFKFIRAGVVYLSKNIQHETIEDPNNASPLRGTIYQHIVDIHEISFPWGLIQHTNVCNRSFSGIEGDKGDKYGVEIRRTKWGCIELLTNEKYCSVRILTIDADHAYSLQRHLCRDEFFIALDDNISLELCSKNHSAAVLEPGSSYSDVQGLNSLFLEKGDYIFIPRGMWHRFKANKDRVRLLEIGYGVYDDIADIQRIEIRDMDGTTSEKS